MLDEILYMYTTTALSSMPNFFLLIVYFLSSNKEKGCLTVVSMSCLLDVRVSLRGVKNK